MTIKTLDLSGERFGRLVAVEPGPRNKHNLTQWWCLCDCGTRKLIGTGPLRSKATKSCGCLANEERASARKKRLARMAAELKKAGFTVCSRPE